jgi:hypothetical protein
MAGWTQIRRGSLFADATGKRIPYRADAPAQLPHEWSSPMCLIRSSDSAEDQHWPALIECRTQMSYSGMVTLSGHAISFARQQDHLSLRRRVDGGIASSLGASSHSA